MKTLSEMREAITSVAYKDWQFMIKDEHPLVEFLDDKTPVRPYLQIEFNAPCNRTGQLQTHKGRKWYLSPHMTQTELVRTAYAAVRTAEEHEMNEKFLYWGRPIANPHINVNALWEVANQEEFRA